MAQQKIYDIKTKKVFNSSNEIFKKANDLNLKRVFAEVSITAKPFFEAKGFKVIKQQNVDISGVKLTNLIMENIKP
ncbi:hypothetical protein [Legionella sp. 29fVS95]|uniref:hypothetical protein n=1 Tax=Legionella sp. 29fVS95 TaxID=3402813 RepID=UPI003AF80311